MFNFLNPVPVYIKLYTDKVEVTRLDTETTISRISDEKFSNERLVVANFYNADQIIRLVLKELLSSNSFIQPSLKVLI